ncbi:carboxymuconolactone decarboxylase family protein [Mitsuaria sp. GD03876]|uniref:carboxymuconolactone decarboxylase family protein n=1 Tax=Mitsuaria sp. GD03876 TaxID=2975399 RepID=UPI002447894A|nr:carboxymuconolactone decarboxylase family protein [Mitsuaria sp. GD03876]MDH0868212.1 carboxymuconolactone decarboxylase family protein [Mitsuaria sp. GD03876]
MSQRLNYMQQSPAAFKKLVELSMGIKESGLEHALQFLVEIRASQLNGCAFCLDMHIKQAAIAGERALRLHHVAIWRESSLFSPRERAALLWTETLTRIPETGVSDEVYTQVREQFSEKELTDLTWAVSSINAWNRLNVAFQSVPGSQDKAFGLDKAGLS